ncbi:MAG: hypothetical protein Q7R95_10310, partial [bacterium]|nr:hypothetical protein [bacterium]
FLILLFLIVVGEGGYLWLLSNKEKDASKIATQLQKSEQSLDLCKKLFPSPEPGQALNEGNLMNLRVLRKGIVKSSSITYQITGIIKEIEYLQKDNNKAIRFTLEADNGDHNNFQYPVQPYVNVKNAQNKKVDLFSLKKGDKITGSIVYEMMNGTYIGIDIVIL